MKNIVICLGENHRKDESVYEALNRMKDAELEAFIKNNNIKDVFFEFVLAKDFPLKYIQNEGLVLDIKLNNLKKVLNHKKVNQSKLIKDDYKEIKTFGNLVGKVGSVKAVELIKNIASNTASYEKLAVGEMEKMGHLASDFTRDEQLKLMSKLEKLGCKIHGLESVESFQSKISNIAIGQRIPALNNSANQIIKHQLSNQKRNALCVMGNAHFINCEQNHKKIDSTQDLLEKSDFKVKTILLMSKHTIINNWFKEDYIKTLEKYNNLNDFNRGLQSINLDTNINKKPPLAVTNIIDNNYDNKSKLFSQQQPVKQATINLESHYKNFLDKAKNEGSFTKRMKLRNDVDKSISNQQVKYLNQKQIYQLGELDLTTWMTGFEKVYKKRGEAKETSPLLEKLSNPNLHLNKIFKSSRLQTLATYFQNDKELFQSLKNYAFKYISSNDKKEIYNAKNAVMERFKNLSPSRESCVKF